MRKLIVSLVLLVAGFRSASATTALPIADAALADQAAVIAEGTVIGSAPAARPGRPAPEYRLRVEQWIKGERREGTLVVRVPGGTASNGLKLKIWGAPELRIGERALMFLAANPDGSYGPLHLALGTFREMHSRGTRLAVRDLSEVYDAGGGESTDGVRDLPRFTRWLKDRSAGVERDADYFVAAPRMDRTWDAFTYLGGIKQRWPDFDLKRDVVWRAHVNGQEFLPGGGFADFQAALDAWTNDPATNIRYVYGGTTTDDTGFQNFDGQNVILFDDVHQEAPGTFSCPRPGQGSGVLAIGGTWFDDSTTPATIGGGDIVINDGASCWFNSNKRAEQVYGHELGHTLGLGHACGDERGGPCNTELKSQALMRATAHNDNRGARLNKDDQAAILSLYPGGSGGSKGKPAAPSDLTAQAVSPTSIRLTWADNSSNETQFRVDVKKGRKFKVVGTVRSNITSVTINGLRPGTSYTFRVLAKKKKVLSDASNTVTIQTPR